MFSDASTIKSTWHIFERSKQKYGNRPCFGRRIRNHKTDELGPFTWLTYNEVADISRCFGSGLINLNLIKTVTIAEDEKIGDHPIKLLGIFTRTCIEFALVDVAAACYGFTLCPLYDTLGESNVTHIIRELKLQTIVVGYEQLPVLFSILEAPENEDISGFVKTIILCCQKYARSKHEYNETYAKEIQAIRKRGIHVLTWTSVIHAGSKKIQPASPSGLKEVHTISYTSGTSGLPKGVVCTIENFLMMLSCQPDENGVLKNIISSRLNLRYLSHLPMAHMFERGNLWTMFFEGWASGFFSGDYTQLVSDMVELDPHVLASVPRLYMKIYSGIQQKLNRLNPFLKRLFDMSIKNRIKSLQECKPAKNNMISSFFINKLKSNIAPSLEILITGAAPLDREVRITLGAYFDAKFFEGYGMTELAGRAVLPFDSLHLHNDLGAVLGGLEFCVEWTDKKRNRGELLFRGPQLFSHYLCRPELNAELFTEDGFFHTGDIVELDPDTNAFRIVDRKKNFFKLSQGEYIAPERLESIYNVSGYIQSICIYGNSYYPYLVAVLVPSDDYIANYNKQNGTDLTLKTAVSNRKFKAALLKDLETFGRGKKLHGFETIKDAVLTDEIFSVENGLLTCTSKVKRKPVLDRYLPELEKLYKK